MSLQSFLASAFSQWQPLPPTAECRTQGSVALSWQQPALGFLNEGLLYTIERKEKIPPWQTVYSGGKTTKLIDNLEPSSPHKFRLRVTLKASQVPRLAENALKYYGDDNTVREKIGQEFNITEDIGEGDVTDKRGNITITAAEADDTKNEIKEDKPTIVTESGDNKVTEKRQSVPKAWLESQWSEEMWTSTESAGTSATCFCMAVRGGYLKQMQIMLEERPALVGIINSSNGFTPLATAIRKGDVVTTRFLLSAGADPDQRSAGGQAPLHLAVLAGHLAAADLLLERGADFQIRDVNRLRVEHYAVESGRAAAVRWALDRGGDVAVTDSNGWTPLFRAVCQGAHTDVVAELVRRGSACDARDAAGLTLPAAARLLRDRHGLRRASVLRAVDAHFPRELAAAHFTRLTRKIARVHTLLNI